MIAQSSIQILIEIKRILKNNYKKKCKNQNWKGMQMKVGPRI